MLSDQPELERVVGYLQQVGFVTEHTQDGILVRDPSHNGSCCLRIGSFSHLCAYGLAEPSQIQRHIVPGAAPDRSGIDTACTVRVRWMLALDVPDGRVHRGMGIIFLCTMSVQTLVNDSTAKAEGLCLSSTAPLHIFADVQLWLHRSTHQGVLTRRPYSSSLAGQAAF